MPHQCYLGKKRLERAIDVYKKSVPGGSEDTFTVTWSPFYLDPSLPKRGIPVLERMAQRFGADRLEAMNARMRLMGRAEGIDFTQQGKVGNTRDAHRLVQLAKTKGLDAQDRVVSELFRSYFEQGGDVTSHEMLVAAAEKAGLDGAEARSWLEGEGGGKEVDAEVEEAYREGIHGVPNFTINDRFKIEGAQDVEAFLEEFIVAKQAAARSNGTSKPGLSC